MAAASEALAAEADALEADNMRLRAVVLYGQLLTPQARQARIRAIVGGDFFNEKKISTLLLSRSAAPCAIWSVHTARCLRRSGKPLSSYPQVS